MNDAEVESLRNAVAKGRVMWTPDSCTARYVKKIAPHVEEGGGDPCAIFAGGAYAALYNCELGEFVSVVPLDAKRHRKVDA